MPKHWPSFTFMDLVYHEFSYPVWTLSVLELLTGREEASEDDPFGKKTFLQILLLATAMPLCVLTKC